MFWYGHHFETPLLIQSFVMIAGMLAMMEICVRVREKTSSFTISSVIGAGPTNPRRRFLIGKLHNNSTSNNRQSNDTGCEDGNISDGTSESMPIYSVPTSPSSGLTTSIVDTQESRYSSAKSQENNSNSYQQPPAGNHSVSYSTSQSSSIHSSTSLSSNRTNVDRGGQSELQDSVSIQTTRASSRVGGNKCEPQFNFFFIKSLFFKAKVYLVLRPSQPSRFCGKRNSTNSDLSKQTN